jgi:hypothetical protein
MKVSLLKKQVERLKMPIVKGNATLKSGLDAFSLTKSGGAFCLTIVS